MPCSWERHCAVLSRGVAARLVRGHIITTASWTLVAVHVVARCATTPRVKVPEVGHTSNGSEVPHAEKGNSKLNTPKFGITKTTRAPFANAGAAEVLMGLAHRGRRNATITRDRVHLKGIDVIWAGRRSRCGAHPAFEVVIRRGSRNPAGESFCTQGGKRLLLVHHLILTGRHQLLAFD